MNKSKILFIWRDLQVGGAEICLINLANALVEKYQITILLYFNRIKIENVPLDQRIKVKYIFNIDPPLDRVPGKLLAFIKIFWECIFADSIICYHVSYLVLLASFAKLILPYRKLYCWMHVCINDIRPSSNKITCFLYKRAINKANKVICVSNSCKESLLKFSKSQTDNLKVIYNLINFKEIPLSIKNTKDDRIKIVSLGRMYPEKGFNLLVGAGAELISKYSYTNFTIKIAGDGPERQNIQSLINGLALNDYVELIGSISKPLEFISGGDILVSCSYTESFSLSVTEALWCSKPVITTNTGAAEIIEYGKFGVLIEKNSASQLAEAIYNLATNFSLRAELSFNAKKALNKFDSEKSMSDWIALIDK